MKGTTGCARNAVAGRETAFTAILEDRRICEMEPSNDELHAEVKRLQAQVAAHPAAVEAAYMDGVRDGNEKLPGMHPTESEYMRLWAQSDAKASLDAGK